MRVWSFLPIPAAAAVLLLTSSIARSDDPVTSAVRFNREIVRIFDRKCLSCHGPGGIAMSLATYREVRPWSRAIREEIVEGRMPPTSAVRGYARLKDDIGLTPRELATILTWVDGGVPRGDDSDLPPPPRPVAAAEPDVTVNIPAQQVPGRGEDVVRRVTVDPDVREERWLRSVQIRPGDRRLLRAAYVSISAADGSSVWAGSWVPWQTEVAPAAPGAFRLTPGARLLIELHYRGGEAPAVDASALGLFFAGEGTWRPMHSLVLAPTPATAAGRATVGKAAFVLKRAALIWGVRLEHPVDGSSIEVTARRPDGPVDVLLWVPRARAEWPAPFIFQDAIPLPAGTVIAVTMSGTASQLKTRAILTLHDAE
jgi:hypothetical protein